MDAPPPSPPSPNASGDKGNGGSDVEGGGGHPAIVAACLGWAWQEVRGVKMRRWWDRVRINITVIKFTYHKYFFFYSPVNIF